MTFGTLEKFGQVEYGDFQTPINLAKRIVETVARKNLDFRAVIEPTCGLGNILFAACELLPNLEIALGLDVNPSYVYAAQLRDSIGISPCITQADFFQLDLFELTLEIPQPYLFIGNPPWVTSATIGQLAGSNLPKKENFQNLSGFDALTGKSNFDISEWILIKLLEHISGTENSLGMLIKTSVARKLIAFCSKKNILIRDFEIYLIDAKKEFNVSVSACFFFCCGAPNSDFVTYEHTVYDDLLGKNATKFLYIDDHFISDFIAFERTKFYRTQNQNWWRSGVKHDLSKIMELQQCEGKLFNGTGELVEIESDLVYPLLKSSDIAKGLHEPRIYTIVTQKSIGASTADIEKQQPLTWAYLKRHEELFNSRKSSIYKNKPLFSIFGVGDYAFAPYKIAISGLYKRLKFTLLAPSNGKCIMVDDTCYFIGFYSEIEAYVYLLALEMDEVREYLTSRISWDDKRPIKKDILDSFNLKLFIKENLEQLRSHSQLSRFPSDQITSWFELFEERFEPEQSLLL
jgi:hypothetical protein